jgi:hypothetical protein
MDGNNKWRWGLFLTMALLLSAALGLTGYLGSVPLVEPDCGQDNIQQVQLDHALRFGQWLLMRGLWAAAATAVLAYGAFYTQIFQWVLGRWATLARLVVCGVLGPTCASWQLYAGLEWAAQVRLTCLGEALLDPDIARHVAISGALLPIDWHWGIRLDALSLQVLGLVLGWLAYRLSANFFDL